MNAEKGSFGFYEHKTALVFLAPLIFFIAVFVLLPVLGTMVTSLYRDVAFLKKIFIGLDNYLRLFKDPGFFQALRFTLCFIFISVPLELALGMMFALVLHERIPGRGFLRVSLLIPWAIPAAISARLWELVYNYHYGFANFLFMSLGFVDTPVHWLGTSTGAFFSLVAADAWKTAPFVAIILLAGLQALSDDLYDQAKIDGAGIFQRFFFITLPQLRPVLVVALLFRTIDALRIFDLIYVLTGGGPGGATNSLSLYGYKYFLASDFGYGSAVSVLLFIIALILSLLTIHWGRFRESVL